MNGRHRFRSAAGSRGPGACPSGDLITPRDLVRLFRQVRYLLRKATWRGTRG